MKLDAINGSIIYYNDNQVIHTREYYNYCLNLFKNYLQNNNVNINIIFGNYNVNFNNANKTIRVDIQCEHTLVKVGGRSVNEKIYGSVDSDDGKYLIRIDKFNYFNSLNSVIEYSQPNIYNISTNEFFSDYLKKINYIAPTIYDIDFDLEYKNDIITLFNSNSGNKRRDLILNDLNEVGVKYKMVENCFNEECLVNTYKHSKIMVNVHQTDHHHTFEELRILPAISNGVIIISEDTPLKGVIPYGEYIVWAPYGELAKKTKEVADNYLEYYDKIFNGGRLKNILLDLKENNKKKIGNIIK